MARAKRNAGDDDADARPAHPLLEPAKKKRPLNLLSEAAGDDHDNGEYGAVDGATESVRDGLNSTIKAIPATPEAAAVPPKGVSGRSLVRRDHFAAALGKLSGSELRLTHLRLAPERIDAQQLTRAGSLRSVQVQPGGSIRQLGPDSGEGFDQTRTIPFARLHAGAPQRLARRGAAKLGVPVSTLQYLVPSLFSGKIMWVAYFERSRYVTGDARGRYQRTYP